MSRPQPRLSTAQHDRAAGVLLGTAVGDALGVPYEFAAPPAPGERAEMLGGGLGDFAPGEWSDDTSMAVAIAEVAATGADLTDEDALDAVVRGLLRWYDGSPADIGVQTRAVLGRVSSRLAAGESGPARIAREEAAAYAARHERSAGNGALMRTAAVALAHLDDRAGCAEAARLVAELTHADPLAGDSCVLWCEAIRVAVLEGRIDVVSGLDLVPVTRRVTWAHWLGEVQHQPGRRWAPNGFTVTALQAALAAVLHTPEPAELPEQASFRCLHLQDALHAAVRTGDDTDTVAAIAGGLLGARWGASAVPWHWRRAVHGWPGRRARDLVGLAALTVRGGEPDASGWPVKADVDYGTARSEPVPHPRDRGVLLGTAGARRSGATAVVSLCRVGAAQAGSLGADVVVESRLVDSDDSVDNPHLGFALRDAAAAVRGLREEGHTVLVHCVAAQQRTPSVAVAYSRLLGVDVVTAREEVLKVLPGARGAGTVWEAAARTARHEHEKEEHEG